jgi:dipeptidyl aminopeptidase/acylaminoacyl peptidase
MYSIHSFLSARLFLAPRLVGERIYFISNLSGRLSLYAMNFGGSVPEPLLPPEIAMQNPDLVDGESFYVFPALGKIIVNLDSDGDENYQPMEIPLAGGFPTLCFNGFFAGYRLHIVGCDQKSNKLFLIAESRREGLQSTYLGDLATGELIKLEENPWGAFPGDHDEGYQKVVLAEGYTTGDVILKLWQAGSAEKPILYGAPLDQRQPDQQAPLSGINSALFVGGGAGLLISCAVFIDSYAPAFLDLAKPGQLEPVTVEGLAHRGQGELESITRLAGERFALLYNIDGCSWLYEADFDLARRMLSIRTVICGSGQLSGGKLESWFYDELGDRFALSFSTAVSPTQIYTVAGKDRAKVIQHTAERVFGIEPGLLSPGEDASFVSFDGLRVSARLYLPAPGLGFSGPRPVVYYIHGGPQGQERPDFAWFSMPLIQYLALNGFAVFVPNVRGSTGYGLSYTKQVDRDWGGQDRLDHVHALGVLASDARLDVNRAAVVGRSYGGYMTLTMAARHPELWKAAVDMFGPFNLLTFFDRLPETWKPYFEIALGHPERDRAFLLERSPQTHIDNIACPLLVIQGKNDPRVKEPESHDLVDYLRKAGKQVDYLVFENEGHDVLKYENRVRCYTEITEFFRKYLIP